MIFDDGRTIRTVSTHTPLRGVTVHYGVIADDNMVSTHTPLRGVTKAVPDRVWLE